MKQKSSLFRIFYKAHVYAGIFVAVHLAIFSLTGVILLFKDELQGQAKPASQALTQTPIEAAQSYEHALSLASEVHPGAQPLAMFPTDNDETILSVRLGVNGSVKLRGAERFEYDLVKKQVFSPSEKSAGFFDWLLRLHREMLLGSIGKLYVGFVGLTYVFMLLSGFFIYGKFMKGRPLGDLRVATVPRLVDLHKFAGVVTFGWAFVVAVTGVFLAFNSVLIKLFLSYSLQHLALQYKDTSKNEVNLAPIGQVIETALQAKPESVVTYVSFPNTEFGIPGQFLLLTNGNTPLTKRLSEMVVVNAETGLLTETIALPAYLKIVLLSEPLHFGDYGGLFLKIIWAIFTLCSLGVAVFGVVSYVLKQVKFKAKRVSKISTKKALRTDSQYPIPAMLAVTSILAMIAALFTQGAIARIASSMLLIPLYILFMRNRRKSEGSEQVSPVRGEL